MCKKTPTDVHDEQVASFAATSLQGRPRVLEIGGDVSARLASLGFAVTRFGAGEPFAGVTRLETDLHAYNGEPFDAILINRTLQTCASLDDTVERVDALLKPNGRVIIEELDVYGPDQPTLAWYYGALHQLTNSELPSDADLLARWRTERIHAGVHSGADMLVALSSRFAIRRLKQVEGLYRDIAALLPPTEDATATAAALRQQEQQRIESGRIVAVGLQIVAERGATAKRADVTHR